MLNLPVYKYYYPWVLTFLSLSYRTENSDISAAVCHHSLVTVDNSVRWRNLTVLYSGDSHLGSEHLVQTTNYYRSIPLHTAHCTLHPEHYTLHTTHSTLNSESCTLHCTLGLTAVRPLHRNTALSGLVSGRYAPQGTTLHITINM